MPFTAMHSSVTDGVSALRLSVALKVWPSSQPPTVIGGSRAQLPAATLVMTNCPARVQR